MGFQLYSRGTKSGGAVLKSSGGGGNSTQTSSSGGGSTQTSSTGGQATVTSASGGDSTETSSNYIEMHSMTGIPENAIPGADNFGDHMHEFVIPGHNHTVNIPSHTHSVTVPNHTHSVSIPSHTHTVNTPEHTHQIDIPDHTHDVEHGIFELDEMPTEVTIEVDGNLLPFNQTSGENIDLIPYLAKDSDGKVQRGRYVEIKITPNDLARINATVTSRLFIQSRIGGTF